MGFAEYSNYDGLGLAELVKKKKVKPAELVEAAIEHIERHNAQLNAVVFKAYDEARAKATASPGAGSRRSSATIAIASAASAASPTACSSSSRLAK